MKILKSKITIKFAVLLILGLGTIIGAGVEPEEKEAPLNPRFSFYQKFSNEGILERFLTPRDLYHFGEVPSPVDRSHVKNVVNPFTRDWYPTSYDLRTMNKLTPIRNQGACGSCWTFATMASLESYGKPGNDWNFSEQDLNVTHGFDYAECNGGNHDMATAYLARWSGPLSETDVPYPYGDGSPAAAITMNGYSPQKHIQQVIFIPQRSNFWDNDTIKYFISTYGAAYVSFYYGSSYIDAADLSFYNNVNTNTNHAVAAVGWDDDYPAGNFRPDRQPPADGAFLIRNSWGTNRHDNGYFWISYYDTSFAPRASFCNAESPDNYKTIYQYDPLGQVGSSGYGGTTAWGANIFTAVGDSSLKAVGFYTNDANTNYEIYIYKGVTPGSPTSGSLGATTTGSRVYPGYYTAVLPTPVSLSTNEVFSVVIKFINSSYTYPIAIERVYNGYSSGFDSNPGESFMSSSGTSWTDTYNYGWNVCIKAFAVDSYTISGTVTSGGEGLGNVLMSGLPGNLLTNGSGFYTANVDHGWSGTVTPFLEGYSFVEPSTTYTNVTSNQTTDYTAEEFSITVTSPNGGENWMVGSIQDITWTTAGAVGNVQIQYSTNSGGNWTEIVASTANDGIHPWTVPDAVSSQCLVRIREPEGPSDISDNVFSIFSDPIITVTSPNGYENWGAASSHNITWTSQGTVGNVKIEYSIDNGDFWTVIIASTENDGLFPWTLPEVDSNQCLVRVSETDGSPTDTSDNVFTIFPPSITVTSPNGGENWQVNSQHTITWTSTGTVGNVQIEYSTNNGDNWTEITPSTENDGSFPWTIPDTVSDLCLIKVSETDGTPADTSDIVFSIRPVSSITVTSPNGSENWDVGSVYDITWTSEGNVGNVRIEFSTNGGNSWELIIQSTENDGSYNWNVPAKPSDNCLVRISETDEDGSPSDVSDAVFSIVSPVTGSITLRSPNGGESWAAGSSQEITWNNTGDINYVTIKYSTDNGTTWKTIAKNAANRHSYNWVVPETVSDRCLVRVTANDGDLDPKPSDVSDAVFSIILPPSPIINVTSPNGGEQLTVGTRFPITWYATNSRGEAIIEYSVNGGENWREIAGSTENDGEYDWTVPDDPSDSCLVRISETGGQPLDISDAVFSIVQPSPGDITVTSPNGGESWNASSSQEITWTAAGIDLVTIEYSQDYGATWKTIVQTTPNSGSFDWTIPGTVSSEECLVRITSNDVSNDPIPADISDAVFSIVPHSSPSITVTTPNGGEQLPVGSMFNITWNAIQSREDVKIDYSVNGGQDWTIITDAADNNGDYEWIVPDTPSETCLVRITEIDGQPLDISDAVFSIVQPVPGEITVTAPNGGESWTVGSLQEIKWTAGGINNVTIEYSTDYGTTWQVIVQTTANDGSFDWTIPDTVSDECLVRVSSNDADPDPVPSDISDEVFSMVPDSAGEFRVTSPNGGESWEVGSTRSITWTGSGVINSVMIEYSYDNGNTWNTIVSSVSNIGTYDWQVPDTVSKECLVRVSANDGQGDPQPTDVSDAVFSILRPSSPTIRVINPNGGEQLVIGTIYEITWFGTDSRAQVKIEYSIDGSEIWTEIIDSTENDGDYDWTVPDEPSSACLVRISEIDGQPVDVSDAVFSIVQPQTGDLTVLTPNGGENLESGTEYNITWNCSGLNNVIIEYSVNNGITWLYIDKVPADNGSFTWTIPGTTSENCLVRVSGADSDENPSDVSDGVFTIFDPSQASIEVITPNGGESLGVGEEYYITWASTGINNILIEYSTTNGEQWIPIDTVPAIGGRFTWTVPDTPSDSCRIRITGNDSPGDPSDVSDTVFSIISN